MKNCILIAVWLAASAPAMASDLGAAAGQSHAATPAVTAGSGAAAGPGDWERKAAFLAGASTVEELSEEVMEKFCSLRDRPLDLNAAPRAKLLSSGLLSPFQVSAFVEYRSATGDVLSFAELALVPGFSEEYADALRPFIVLKTGVAPGTREDRRLDHTLTLRGAVRREGDASIKDTDRSAGLKYEARWGEKAEFRWSTRTTYDDGSVKLGTLSAAVYGKRALGKLVLGNFSARFGQGLAQWSGFSLGGYPTVASFRKNGTGLSPTGSFSPELNGVASDWNIGHFTLSGAVSLRKDNIASIANLCWTGRRVSAGSTCVWSPVDRSAKFSADWRAGLPGLSLFGEVAAKCGAECPLSPAAVAGGIWTPSYGTKLSLLGRYFTPSFSNEWSGAALGYENLWLSATLDAARRKEVNQFKSVIQFKREFSLDSLSLAPSLRLNARLRPGESVPKRIDIRGDFTAKYGVWSISGRYNALWSKDFAWLWYAEAGRNRATESRTFGLYARFTLFRVDNWDDRIYVYERDAPGSFNVPAYYGRGYALSLVSSVKRRRHAFYFRTAWTSYPWNPDPKPGRFELKVQYTLRISGYNKPKVS